MSKALREIEQQNLDVCEAVATYFIDAGGTEDFDVWTDKQKKMAGSFIMQAVAERLAPLSKCPSCGIKR